MKVSRAVVEQNREAILGAAARLFRERGFDGVSVADLMQAAGLTHGAFYGYFDSKEALATKACEVALQQSVKSLSGHDLERLVQGYLSVAHRDDVAGGCTLAALASEASRHEGPLKDVFTKAIGDYVELFVKVEKEGSAASRRKKALATVSMLVGAVVLARAVNDEGLSDEILGAAARSLVSRRGGT